MASVGIQKQASPNTVFNHKPTEFSDRFGRIPFEVSHNLRSDHPLFQMDRLAELSKILWLKGEGRVVRQEANVPVNCRWDEIDKLAMSPVNWIKQIKEPGSWIKLKRIHEDPEYAAFIDSCVDELDKLVGGGFKERITSVVGSFFISSPHSITPYHIDHESNFLLQLYGSRNVYVCEPGDRTILSDEEIESFYAGDLSAPKYSAAKEEKAHVFAMSAGKGVHIPSKGPHWVRNGNDYSIALSVNFCLTDIDNSANVYQFNHYLRKLRLNPQSPGRSALKDRLKAATLADFVHPKPTITNFEMVTRNIKRLDRIYRLAAKVVPRRSQQS